MGTPAVRFAIHSFTSAVTIGLNDRISLGVGTGSRADAFCTPNASRVLHRCGAACAEFSGFSERGYAYDSHQAAGFLGFTVTALIRLSSTISNLPNPGRALQIRTGCVMVPSIGRIADAVQVQR